MITKKKIFALIIAVLLVFTFLPSCTFATDACEEAGVNDELICGSSNSDEELALMNRIRGVLNTVYLWVGIISVIVIVIGGIQYMTSNGEAEKIKRAKASILYSLCGLIVTLSAFAITTLVINSLNGTTSSEDSGENVVYKDRDKVKSIFAVKQSSLIVGQTVTLKARVIPDYAKNKDLSYKTSDENIATVDQKGEVKAKKEGEATITISSSDGPSSKTKIIVKKPIPVEKIELSTKTVNLKKGASATVKAKPLPSNATDKTLIWSSADSSIATVTQAGKIKAIKDSGDTTVTVKARNQQSIAATTPYARLADYELSAAEKIVKETVNVSIIANKLDFSYKGNGSVKSQFSSPNMRIVEKHLYDLNYNNYYDVLNKKYGGKFENYAKDVGGIYGDYYGKTMNAKSEYDFQMAAEYVFGWMYMIGFDYRSGGGTYHKWGSGGGETHSDDAFYPGTMNYTSDWGGQGLDKALASADGHDRAMMTECGPTAWEILAKAGLGDIKAISKPSRLNDLRPGDLIRFFNHKVTDEASTRQADHVAIIGEVSKNQVIIYDGGGYFINNRNYKRPVAIPDSGDARSILGYTDWVAERYRNLKQ